MSTDPKDAEPTQPTRQEDAPGIVSEPEADPTPPATDATTAEDVDDTPQMPTRQDVAEKYEDE